MSWAGQVALGESEAVALAAARDNALEELVRAHARLVFRVAYSVLRNREDAEDAAQETFLRLLRQDLSKIADARLWLARVAWRAAVDRVRRRPTLSLEDAPLIAESLAAAGQGAEAAVLESQMKALLERMIDGLPGELRDVVRLTTIEEMNSADVAQVLRIPEGSVRTRLFRARQLLREKMLRAMG